MSTVDLQPGSPQRQQAEALADFLDRYYADELMDIATGGTSKLHVDAGDLLMWCDSEQELSEYLLHPSETADVIQGAIGFADNARDAITPEDVTVAIVDEAGAEIPHYGVAEINSDQVRDYIGVSGQLSAVTKIREFPKEAKFRCRCGITTTVPQDTREFQFPTGVSCNCETSPTWELDYEGSTWVDHRKLKIQQPPEKAANGETQHLTAHVFGEATSDLQGRPLTERVGEDVVVYGTIELVQQDGRGSADYLFNHYLKTEAVTFDESGLEAVDIDAHRDEIETHANADDVYERFYESLAPQIHPTEQMELAMKVCAAYLFASPRIDPDNGPMYRGDMHAALIGDPGMAKSVLLSGVAKFSPDCEHRSATGLSSDVGLVAAAVDDDFGEGGWTLKPGILVRSGMHAIIDEIDKGPDELEKINDALEGRQIASIDKAGMKADLKTRTGLLASGNPEGSRFDVNEPLAPQVDINESLLTRFDAIVLLIDEVDEEQDRAVADHITSSFMEGVDMVRDTGETVEQETTDRVVSPDVGRAWVALGRRIVPELPEEAAEKLQEFYVDVRSFNGDNADSIAATARQLEAGVRFAMAFARMRLSETVEPRDVDMAIEVSRALIGQTFDAESGTMNIDNLTVDTSPGQKTTSDYESIRGKLKEALETDNWQYADEIARETGVDESKIRNALSKAESGEISLAVESRNGMWRLQS